LTGVKDIELTCSLDCDEGLVVMDNNIRIILADKGEIFREGLIKVLERVPNLEVVATCARGFDVIEKAKVLKPDVILLDDDISDCDCMETSQTIHSLMPEICIVILTSGYNSRSILPALNKAGARGYISKSIEPERLFDAVEIVAKGGVVISPMLAACLVNELNFLKKSMAVEELTYDAGLSKREEEVLALVSTGARNSEIADALSISENTVKVHLGRILDKLHVHNRQQATILARERGFIPKSGRVGA